MQALDADLLWEYTVLVTDVAYPLESIGQLYRVRCDCENGFEELKNQWGLSGFATQDIYRCQRTAKAVAHRRPMGHAAALHLPALCPSNYQPGAANRACRVGVTAGFRVNGGEVVHAPNFQPHRANVEAISEKLEPSG